MVVVDLAEEASAEGPHGADSVVVGSVAVEWEEAASEEAPHAADLVAAVDLIAAVAGAWVAADSAVVVWVGEGLAVQIVAGWAVAVIAVDSARVDLAKVVSARGA